MINLLLYKQNSLTGEDYTLLYVGRLGVGKSVLLVDHRLRFFND